MVGRFGGPRIREAVGRLEIPDPTAGRVQAPVMARNTIAPAMIAATVTATTPTARARGRHRRAIVIAIASISSGGQTGAKGARAAAADRAAARCAHRRWRSRRSRSRGREVRAAPAEAARADRRTGRLPPAAASGEARDRPGRPPRGAQRRGSRSRRAARTWACDRWRPARHGGVGHWGLTNTAGIVNATSGGTHIIPNDYLSPQHRNARWARNGRRTESTALATEGADDAPLRERGGARTRLAGRRPASTFHGDATRCNPGGPLVPRRGARLP